MERWQFGDHRGVVDFACHIRHVGLCAEHVFRQRQNHRTGPTRLRDTKRASNVFRQAIRVIDLSHPFDQTTKHGFIVNLLKCFAVCLAIVDLAHEQHQRRAVLHGNVHARAGICRPGAAGDECHTGLTCHFSIGVRHHRNAALLTANDIVDARVIQTVERGEETFTGNRKYPPHAEAYQLIDKDLTAVSCHGALHKYSPISWRYHGALVRECKASI